MDIRPYQKDGAMSYRAALIAAIRCEECGTTPRQPAPPEPRIEVHTNPLIEIEGRLRLVAHARGYKPGWVWHRLREIAEHAEASNDGD